jgi:HD-GYP domain-containing protein (c-di-GMP phosphodiesterase class II)
MIIISNRFFELSLMHFHTKAQQHEAQMLSSLNAISLARDNETGQHILRTKTYVKQIALRLRQLGLHTKSLDDQQIENLYKAAPLHDIGKVGIPDYILHKNGPLTAEEWIIMKTHTTIGETILKTTDSTSQATKNVLSAASEISGGHHERWDGTGYPRGIRGEDTPLAARIMSLADVYDALVSKRVYKAAWSHEDACKEIISKSGTHFDPQVVQAFALEMSAFREIALQFQDPV